MITAFEDAIDFVSSHYSYTERTEPFWQHVKENFKPSERLKTIIDNHINLDFVPTSKLYENNKIFSPINYTLWLEQLGYTKKSPINLHTHLLPNEIRDYLIHFSDTIQSTYHNLHTEAVAEVETYEKYAMSPFRPEKIR